MVARSIVRVHTGHLKCCGRFSDIPCVDACITAGGYWSATGASWLIASPALASRECDCMRRRLVSLTVCLLSSMILMERWIASLESLMLWRLDIGSVLAGSDENGAPLRRAQESYQPL